METEKPYNRLVIIGNGFDLALGLPTSYLDLLKFLFFEICEKTNRNQLSNDGLFTFSTIPSSVNSLFIEKIFEYTSADELIKHMYSLYSFKNDGFIQFLFETISIENWVDLEGSYFQYLKREYNYYKDSDDRNKRIHLSNIVKANKQIEVLQQKLYTYLKVVESQLGPAKKFNEMNLYLKELQQAFHPHISEEIAQHKRLKPPTNIIFLTFNYTNSLEWLKKMDPGNRVNNDNFRGPYYIHGRINYSTVEELIFGYGDDVHDFYKELESENIAELIRLNKAFKYPQHRTYNYLMGELERSEFDIIILGHSCGLSDRTLLKTIFEHEKCIGISRANYQSEKNNIKSARNDDLSKVLNISRHFGNKVVMRSRLFSFNKELIIPQIEKTKFRHVYPY